MDIKQCKNVTITQRRRYHISRERFGRRRWVIRTCSCCHLGSISSSGLSSSKAGPETLFLLDKNLTILSKAGKEILILLWGLLVPNQRRRSESEERFYFLLIALRLRESVNTHNPSNSSQMYMSLLNSSQTPLDLLKSYAWWRQYIHLISSVHLKLPLNYLLLIYNICKTSSAGVFSSLHVFDWRHFVHHRTPFCLIKKIKSEQTVGFSVASSLMGQ